jgi:hypothetical protein
MGSSVSDRFAPNALARANDDVIAADVQVIAVVADDKASIQSRVWRGLFCRWNDRHAGYHDICII